MITTTGDRSGGGLAATTFFSRTYDEAVDLVAEARDYMRHGVRDEAEFLAPTDRILCTCESMRLTARLTQVMAWLLLQRAMHAGETTADEVRRNADNFKGHEVCLAASPGEIARLPERLRDLLGRSENLYRRVSRLNDMVAGDGAAVTVTD